MSKSLYKTNAKVLTVLNLLLILNKLLTLNIIMGLKTVIGLNIAIIIAGTLAIITGALETINNVIIIIKIA